MIISMSAEKKTSEKPQHAFMIKIFHKLRIVRKFLNPEKGIYEKTPQLRVCLMVKDRNFTLKIKNKTRYPLSPLLFSIVLKVLGRAIRQEVK